MIDLNDNTDQLKVFLVVVDNTAEMRLALRYASLRAKKTGGRVGLLRVVRKADFQHWAAIGNLMREEAREQAEQLLQELRKLVIHEYSFFMEKTENTINFQCITCITCIII